jgi:tubulysin polyketide synthase-like protein
MSALALLQQLHALDVALEPHLDGTLRYRAPKGVLTPALLDGMRQHKPELHALVEEWSERAALMEYDGRLPRDEAERLAWVCIQSARDVCTV